MISCRSYSPCALLQNHIRFYYLFEHSGSPADASFQLVTPDGCVEINFNLQSPLHRREQTGELKIQNNFYVVSRFSHHYYLKRSGTVRMIGIRFYPWGIHPFIKCAANEIADKMLDQEDIFGSSINSLREQVLNISSPEKAVRAIENFFIKKLYSPDKNDSIVMDAAERILNSKGRINMKALLAPYNISSRRIQQRFNENIGVSPSFFKRLIKFLYALRQIHSLNGAANLLDVTYESGYFDQPHFNHDFKIFSGLTPKKYLSEEFPLNKLMSAEALAD